MRQYSRKKYSTSKAYITIRDDSLLIRAGDIPLEVHEKHPKCPRSIQCYGKQKNVMERSQNTLGETLTGKKCKWVGLYSNIKLVIIPSDCAMDENFYVYLSKVKTNIYNIGKRRATTCSKTHISNLNSTMSFSVIIIVNECSRPNGVLDIEWWFENELGTWLKLFRLKVDLMATKQTALFMGLEDFTKLIWITIRLQLYIFGCR